MRYLPLLVFSLITLSLGAQNINVGLKLGTTISQADQGVTSNFFLAPLGKLRFTLVLQSCALLLQPLPFRFILEEGSYFLFYRGMIRVQPRAFPIREEG
jgi:hypothetical protein